MGLAEVVAVLRADTSQFTAKIGEARAEVDKLSKSGASSFEKFASAGKAAFLGVAAVAVTAGAMAVKFGSDQEDAQAGLQASLKAAGISWDSVKDKVSAAGSQMTKYGFTQAQVDAALKIGVISTQSYSGAHKNLAVAVQLAAAKHIDLSTAMTMVDKAVQGNTRVLKQLGIDQAIAATSALKVKQAQEALFIAQVNVNNILTAFPAAADLSSKAHGKYEAAVQKTLLAQSKLKDMQSASGQVLDVLSQRLGGQASAAANTFAGKLKAATAEGKNLEARIGIALIPILEKLMDAVSNTVKWLEKHKVIAEALAVVVGGALTLAFAAWAVSLFATDGALAILVSPIAAVVAGVALLAAGIILLSTHWSQVWGDIKKWTADAIDFLQQHFYILLTIPIVGWILDLALHWQQVWDGIKSVISVAWNDVLKPTFGFINDYGIQPIHDAIQTLLWVWNEVWGGVHAAISEAWKLIKPIFDDMGKAIGVVADAINGLKSAFDSVKGFLSGNGSALTSQVNTAALNMATGAITGGTPHNAAGTGMGTISGWSWVGENGPELVRFGRPAQIKSTSESKQMVSAGGRSGPLMNIGELHLHEESDLNGLMMKAAFLATQYGL